jgi:hypothetical protein
MKQFALTKEKICGEYTDSDSKVWNYVIIINLFLKLSLSFERFCSRNTCDSPIPDCSEAPTMGVYMYNWMPVFTKSIMNKNKLMEFNKNILSIPWKLPMPLPVYYLRWDYVLAAGKW